MKERMKGGLEKDDCGHPAVISFAFLPPFGSLFSLFPPSVSPDLLSFPGLIFTQALLTRRAATPVHTHRPNIL